MKAQLEVRWCRCEPRGRLNAHGPQDQASTAENMDVVQGSVSDGKVLEYSVTAHKKNLSTSFRKRSCD